MAVTILDVAKRAQVGVGTVSRVINGANHVRPATRQRIEAAMRELGYHPNAHARNLKRQNVAAIGFLFASHQRRLSDPFFNILMAGMADAAGDSGYDLLVASCRQPANELNTLRRLISGQRIGSIIVTDTRVRDPRIALLHRLKFPCVVFGRVGTYARNHIPSIDVDNKHGVKQAVTYLFSRGHERIGFITLPRELTCAQDRLTGFRAAFVSAGCVLDERWIVDGGLSEEDGMRAAAQLLDLPLRPTAIMASSDVLAFGAMRAIQQKGLRVGGDVALIGFDDIPIAAHTHPPLCTVRQPIYDIGVQLVKMLVERKVGVQVIEPELVIRDSVG